MGHITAWVSRDFGWGDWGHRISNGWASLSKLLHFQPQFPLVEEETEEETGLSGNL